MKVAFPTDEHRPFHDAQAVALAQRIVGEYAPDLLVVGSDGMDFYAVSRFDKNPERMKAGLQGEIDSWIEGQREWRDAAPDAIRVHIKGNHEARLGKYLCRHPELYGLEALSFPALLQFDALGILDAEEEVAIGDRLVVRHGQVVRRSSAMSAKAEAEQDFYAISTLTGHSHRGGSFYATTRRGTVQAHECFCLCRLDPDYTDRPDWQQGIVLAEVNDTGVFVEPVPFFDFRGRKVARWRGREYSV